MQEYCVTSNPKPQDCNVDADFYDDDYMENDDDEEIDDEDNVCDDGEGDSVMEIHDLQCTCKTWLIHYPRFGDWCEKKNCKM